MLLQQISQHPRVVRLGVYPLPFSQRSIADDAPGAAVPVRIPKRELIVLFKEHRPAWMRSRRASKT